MTSIGVIADLVVLTRDLSAGATGIVSTYRDDAIVLGAYKFGEADKVMVLLTRHHGKVRAVARGVRKTRSSIGARLEPMSHVDVSFRKGRDLDTIAEVRLVASHEKSRMDFARVSQGLAMIEAVEKMTPDREPVEHLFEVLSRALSTLDEQLSPLMVGAFYWRVLAMEGHAPQLDECVVCGAREGLVQFHIIDGGVLCKSCGVGMPISAVALEILREIVGGRMHAALAREESPAVNEVNHLAMDAMEAHLERRVRSLGSFDRHL